MAQWLESNRPPEGDLTVMHGDYKTDNAMFSKSVPPRILSLVDFEMTTVGDPLIDLGWAMIFWPEEGNLIAIAAPGAEGGMSAQHCQAPQVLIDRYAAATGLADCFSQRLTGIDLAAGNHHLRAAASEFLAHGPAEAAAAAGDHHHFVCHVEHVRHTANLCALSISWSTTKPKNSWLGFFDSPLRYLA